MATRKRPAGPEQRSRPAAYRRLGLRAGITLVIYLSVVAVGATDIYDPLEQGRNDLWIVVIGLAGAQLALGVGIGRPWALAVAVIIVALGVLVWGHPYVLAQLITLMPLATGMTALGLLLARSRYATALTVAAFLTAAPGLVWGFGETIKRYDAPRVSAAFERRLPTDFHLANLCPGSVTPKRLRARLEAQAETLIREVQRRPDWLVPYTYYSSDTEPSVERREITVRELAEEELGFYEAAGPRCKGGYQARLRAALD